MSDKLKFLVVEDEDFMRKLVCRILVDLGHRQIIDAEDGQGALKAMVTTGGAIDLIFLDIEMPKLGGLDFLRLVRTSPSSPNKDVPVVILTGHSNIKTLKDAAALGIHGFLTKPVSKANMEKQIKRALEGPAIDPAKIAGIRP